MEKKIYYLFQNLVIIAQASGGIDETVRGQLEETADDLGVPHEDVQSVVEAVQSGQEQNLRFLGNHEEKQRAFHLMCEVATRDGQITAPAHTILRRVAGHYDVPDEDLEELLADLEVVEHAVTEGAGAQAPTPATAPAQETQPGDASAQIILGRLAVIRGYATVEEVDHCVHLQESLEDLGARLSFGEILVGEGYLEPEQVNELLSCHEREVLEEGRRFGNLAIQNGLTTAEKVDKALWTQGEELKEEGEARPIGEILIEQGSITEQELKALLRAQDRIETRQEA